MQEDFRGAQDPLLKFETMLKTDDVYFFDAEDFEEIVHHYLAIGKLSLAKKATKLGLEQHPNAIHLELLRAEIMIFEDKLDLADDLLRELQQLDSLNDEVYIQRAHIFSKKDNHEAAITILEQALNKGLNSFDVLDMIGMEYVFLDDYSKAKIYFKECLHVEGEDDSVLCNLMLCYNCLEEFGEAIEFLGSYIDKYPYSQYAWLEKGRFHIMELELDEAITAFDYAIIIDENFTNAHMEKASALEMKGEVHAALEVYLDVIKSGSPHAYVYYRLGKCYHQIGHEEQARLHYFKSVQEDPLMYKAWIGIVDYYIKRRDFDESVNYLFKAFETEPHIDLFQDCVEDLNSLMGKEVGEGFQANTLSALPKLKVETWNKWGMILIRSSLYSEALDVFGKAREYYPEDENIQLHLAGLYLRNNQSLNGRLELEAALTKNKDLVEVLEEYYPKVFLKETVQKIINNLFHK